MASHIAGNRYANSGASNVPGSRYPSSGEVSSIITTQVDWLETTDGHIFKIDLPGLTRDDVKVKIEDGETLEISGERLKEEGEKTDTWHLLERTPGTYLRKFSLPENINKEAVKAQVENGVLTVVLPKIACPKPEVRAIEVQIDAVKAQVENGVLTITLGSEHLPKILPPRAEVRRIEII